MKPFRKLLAAGLVLMALAGCKDAKASLTGAAEPVLTVGSKTVSKGDLYSAMFSASAAASAYNDAMKVITDAEVEVTDEMKEEAKSQAEMMTMYYGSQFNSYLESMNMTIEEYAEKNVLPDLKITALNEKYIRENLKTLSDQYKPVKAIVLSFSAQEDASSALSALKDGSKTASEAATSFNSTSSGNEEVITTLNTSYDSTVLSIIRSASPDDGWTQIPSADGSTFYVLKVVSNDPTAFEEDAVKELKNISAISDLCTDTYLRKYGFHVYDIDLYNAIKEYNSSLLVQDTKAPTPAPAAEETAAAETPAAEPSESPAQ
ncbi:MAG: hypothetical protein IKS32_09700 [Solobacterium sp.]|nr:hypothetical protein [Solobacterium sp.]